MADAFGTASSQLHQCLDGAKAAASWGGVSTGRGVTRQRDSQPQSRPRAGGTQMPRWRAPRAVLQANHIPLP